MPEGDNVARIADVLGEILVGRQVTRARAPTGAAQLERLVSRQVTAVSARGKHLLVDFTGGLTLHTHLGLHGSWHRYRPGEAWRLPASRAVVVVETGTAVCVCFDAPTVELVETRALDLHPALAALGPGIAAADFEPRRAVGRIRRLSHPEQTVGEALLDQRLIAGLGNVYRSELCFLARISPFTPLGDVDDDALRELLERGFRLVAASRRSGRRVTTAPGSDGLLYVYGRTGRPCRRCATPVASTKWGDPPRRVYWCRRCQPAPASDGGTD